MSAEALTTAKALWTAQQGQTTNGSDGRDDSGNMSRFLDLAKVAATVELIITTKGDPVYTARLRALTPAIEANFDRVSGAAVRALPYMDAGYRTRIKALVGAAKARADSELAGNPFGVPVATGSWAGSGEVAGFGINMYLMHKAFPDLIGPEYTLHALDYMLGRHPANNLSLVSTVGTRSKLNGYGHNRADYGFIPGGMAPGVLIIKPDFPEMMTDWPFLWFESEYTVSTTTAYILAAKAAIAATEDRR
jgi:hypothetical protein